jgi:HlyD family secretion protein
MPKIGLVLGGMAIAGLGAFALNSQYLPGHSAAPAAIAAANPAKPATADVAWIAAAPGRVEPKAGEVRIGAGMLGRVVEVLARVNDRVEEGELLVRLDDDEARARLAAAEAEAGGRRQERDNAPATSGREDIRKAEDAVFNAERAETGARYELDFALAAKRGGTIKEQSLADARRRYTTAKERLERERLAFASAQAKANLPAPNRAESGLSAARAQVSAAEAALDKTRIRAPMAGTVLQVPAKLGEIVAPSPEQPLIVIGDMSLLRVKAEIDEADVSKIKVGQKAFVRSISYPGREFAGTVTALSPSLAPPRIGLRGPRRPTDVEVLEVTIDLEPNAPLLPGMRVDAFFRRQS